MGAIARFPETARRAMAVLGTAFDQCGADGEQFLHRVIERWARSEGGTAQTGVTLRVLFDHAVEEYAASMPALSAVRAGHAVPLGTYDVVDYLASSAATVGEGFARLSRYLQLARPESAFVVQEADEPRVVLQDRRRTSDWFFDEWTLGVTLRGFRATLGPIFGPTAWGLRRPRPEPSRALSEAVRLVGVAPSFGEAAAYFVFTREAWETPLPTHNARIQSALVAHAEALLSEQSGSSSTAGSVRELLAKELQGGDPSIERVAKRLATTPRTLQRRLRDEATSFQDVLDGLRSELAQRYLGDGKLDVSEVAFLLGYSEASAFARAYKRWHGVAPSEARRR